MISCATASRSPRLSRLVKPAEERVGCSGIVGPLPVKVRYVHMEADIRGDGDVAPLSPLL